MGRRLRQTLRAPYFHVINRSVRRVPLFIRPLDYRAFLDVLAAGLDRYDVRLIAYCLLSNHWHLIVEPAGTKTLTRFMHWVTVTHAVRWHRHHKTVGQGPVYQGRYHSIPLETPQSLMRACRYVERNALAAKLVRRAQDWPWCSLSDRIRGEQPVPLKAAPFFTSTAWLNYVNDEIPEEILSDMTAAPDWRDAQTTTNQGSPVEEQPRPGTQSSESVEKTI